MANSIEADILHHDFAAKLRSVHDALLEPLDPEAAACAVEVALLLREPMWRQAAWRNLDRDAALAAAAAIRLGFPEKAASLLVYRAGVREALGEWREVEPLVRQALTLGKNRGMRAEAMLHLGTASHNLGRYAGALSAFSSGLEACQTKDMRHRILQKLYRTERAIGNVDSALEIIAALDSEVAPADRWFRAELILDRAALVRSSNPHLALELAKEAKEMYLALRFTRGEAYADLERGRSLRASGDWKAAAESLSQAKAIFDRTRYLPGACHVRFEQAQISMDRGDITRALQLFGESYALARQIRYHSALLRISVGQWNAHWRARHLFGVLRTGARAACLLTLHSIRRFRARRATDALSSWRVDPL